MLSAEELFRDRSIVSPAGRYRIVPVIFQSHRRVAFGCLILPKKSAFKLISIRKPFGCAHDKPPCVLGEK